MLKVTEFHSGQSAWESCSGLSQCLRDYKAGLKISLELGRFLARNHRVGDTLDDIGPSREVWMGQGSVLGCGESARTHGRWIFSEQWPCFGDLIFPGEAVLFSARPHKPKQTFAAMGCCQFNSPLGRLERKEEAQSIEAGLENFTVNAKLLNRCWEEACVSCPATIA